MLLLEQLAHNNVKLVMKKKHVLTGTSLYLNVLGQMTVLNAH